MDEPPIVGMDEGRGACALGARSLALCPYCDYELAGLAGDRCPECGNEISEADIRFDERRRVFLELTRWRVIGGNAVALLLSMWVTWGLTLIPFGLGFFAAWVAPRGTPGGLVGRVRRRVWMLGLWRLHLPWIIGAVTPPVLEPVADWVSWNTGLLNWTGGEYIEYLQEILGPVGVAAALLIVYLVSVLLWRGRLQSLARVAGLQDRPGYDPFPWRCVATRMAVYPVLVVLLVRVAVPVAVALLDSFRPNWGTGW